MVGFANGVKNVSLIRVLIEACEEVGGMVNVGASHML